MSVVLICRTAEEDSLIGNMGVAKAFAAAGQEATIVFAGEALHALDRGTLRWSESFKGRDARATIIRGAEGAGVAVADRARDKRWSDVRTLLEDTAADGAVRLVACPVWAGFLGQTEEPSYLDRIDETQLVALLAAADTVVGGY
jgi:peroxiredoxin family protein